MGAVASSCCCNEKVDQVCVSGVVNSTWRIFTYKELYSATNGFSEGNLLGEGGFGSVYWGKTSDGLQIAVKKLKAANNSKAEMEFAVEVEVLARVRHKNLLGLRGYCAVSTPRGEPAYHPPGHQGQQRAAGLRLRAPRGRLRLREAHPRRRQPHDDPRQGHLGYLAPEYAMWGKVSGSCDVYSFGILLLELISGRKPIEKLPGGIKRTITEWAEPIIASGRLGDLVDPRLRGEYDPVQLRRVVEAAALCVQGEPERRPDMREVVAILRGEDTTMTAEAAAAATTKGGRDKVGDKKMLRIESVSYGEHLMNKYDDGGGDNGDDDDNNDDGEMGDDVESKSMYGVFGVMDVQKMRDPYMRHGDGRRVMHG
uniref:Serine-threonine/tyrosine-protein kinase catalytic domain-containing protein n=1 Tax=Ananas comosus var. bracteatus TaxID=296719 RepID=A0A6V7PM66_ANACO|nr:unnamed protein product [Ananas comosus var. bracteatus]